MDEDAVTEQATNKKRKKEAKETYTKSKRSKQCKKSKKYKHKHDHLRARYAEKAEKKLRYGDRLKQLEIIDIGLCCINEFERWTAAKHGLDSTSLDEDVRKERLEKWVNYLEHFAYEDPELPDVRKTVSKHLTEFAYHTDLIELSDKQSEDAGEIIGAINDPHLFTRITAADTMDFIYMLWDTKDELLIEVLSRRPLHGGFTRPCEPVQRCFFRILNRILHEYKYLVSESESSDYESDSSASSSQEHSSASDDSSSTHSSKRTRYDDSPTPNANNVEPVKESAKPMSSNPPECISS